MTLSVLWVCSWYPNLQDRFRGDFIQRQAVAVSQFCRVHVIHILESKETKHEVTRVNANLLETIYYVNKPTKIQHLLYSHKIIKQHLAINSYDIIHAHIPYPLGFSAAYFAKKHKKPFLLSEHYGIYNNEVEDSYFKRHLLFKVMTKYAVKRANLLLTVSRSLGSDMKSIFSKEYMVIPNAVNTNLFFRRQKQASPKFKFIHVSNMTSLKNVEGILDATQKLAEYRKDFEVLLIGAKPTHIESAINLNEDLKSLVTLIGEIPYNKVSEHVSDCQAGILFSKSETQSCVILEWLCSGLPVITSSVGGAAELINKGNGLQVPSMDTDALCIAMNDMIVNYENYDHDLISEEAANKYGYEPVGKRIFDLYQVQSNKNKNS